jgi:hypothetical protein
MLFRAAVLVFVFCILLSVLLCGANLPNTRRIAAGVAIAVAGVAIAGASIVRPDNTSKKHHSQTSCSGSKYTGGVPYTPAATEFALNATHTRALTAYMIGHIEQCFKSGHRRPMAADITLHTAVLADITYPASGTFAAAPTEGMFILTVGGIILAANLPPATTTKTTITFNFYIVWLNYLLYLVRHRADRPFASIVRRLDYACREFNTHHANVNAHVPALLLHLICLANILISFAANQCGKIARRYDVHLHALHTMYKLGPVVPGEYLDTFTRAVQAAIPVLAGNPADKYVADICTDKPADCIHWTKVYADMYNTQYVNNICPTTDSLGKFAEQTVAAFTQALHAAESVCTIADIAEMPQICPPRGSPGAYMYLLLQIMAGKPPHTHTCADTPVDGSNWRAMFGMLYTRTTCTPAKRGNIKQAERADNTKSIAFAAIHGGDKHRYLIILLSRAILHHFQTVCAEINAVKSPDQLPPGPVCWYIYKLKSMPPPQIQSECKNKVHNRSTGKRRSRRSRSRHFRTQK